MIDNDFGSSGSFIPVARKFMNLLFGSAARLKSDFVIVTEDEESFELDFLED